MSINWRREERLVLGVYPHVVVDSVEVLVLFHRVKGYGSVHLLVFEPTGERLTATRIMV